MRNIKFMNNSCIHHYKFILKISYVHMQTCSLSYSYLRAAEDKLSLSRWFFFLKTEIFKKYLHLIFNNNFDTLCI